MKDYFLEIVKDGVRVEAAHTKANNQEEANTVVTKSAIGRGMENFSVREITKEEFDAFVAKKQEEAKAAEAQTGAAAEPEQKPKATVSINGGPKIDATSPEAIEALQKAAAELGDSPENVFVSFDGGPELAINSLAAEEAFNALAHDVDHSIVIVAKQPVNDEPPAPGEEGNAANTGTAESSAGPDAVSGAQPEEKAAAEGTESAAAA